MPIARSDQLFNLIKSLNKSEKRNFKLYTNRLNSNEHVKFIRLFDIIDKSKSYQRGEIKKHFKKISNNQFANLKRHLYTQILKSLRLIHNKKEVDLQIRELLDFAKILYTKSLYLQSLKILDKAKMIAKKANQDMLLMEILEFEKLIESRHITRSRKVANKVEALIEESTRMKKVISNASNLANLNLKIHGLYIKMGYVKSELDRFIVRDYFSSNLPSFNAEKLSFFEKIYLHQSYVWYYYTLMDFRYCYRHAYKWVTLFQEKSIMIDKDPDLYMRGLHYLLTSLFNMRQIHKYIGHFHSLEEFHKERSPGFNPTSQLIYFIYGYNARLNYHFLKGEYEEAKYLIPRILSNISKFESILDQHRKIIFYYKISWLHFALKEYEKAIDYLNEINNLKKEHLRSDIQCYTKLIILLCHFELGNYALVSNLLPSVNRFFKKANENNPATKEILTFLKQRSNGKQATQAIYKNLRKKMLAYRNHPYHKRAFIYFDFISWVDSRIEKETVANITRKYYFQITDKN